MKVEHQELRSAFIQFLAAKRTLRQAYGKSEAARKPTQSIPTLEGETTEQAPADSLLWERVQELTDENVRLRKLLGLLYEYTLRVHDERDDLECKVTDSRKKRPSRRVPQRAELLGKASKA